MKEGWYFFYDGIFKQYLPFYGDDVEECNAMAKGTICIGCDTATFRYFIKFEAESFELVTYKDTIAELPVSDQVKAQMLLMS